MKGENSLALTLHTTTRGGVGSKAGSAPRPPGCGGPRLSSLLPLFIALAQDDQDSVRLQSADNCVALAKILTIRCDRNPTRAAGSNYASAAAAAAGQSAYPKAAGSPGLGGEGGPADYFPGPLTDYNRFSLSLSVPTLGIITRFRDHTASAH